MTIDERIKRIKVKSPENIYIQIFDNRTEYSPEDISFYLCDYDKFNKLPVMNYQMDTEEHKQINGVKTIQLGFECTEMS